MGRIRQAWKALGRATGKHSLRWAGPPLLGGLARTWSVDVEGEEMLQRASGAEGGRFMALWHGRMLVAAWHHGHQGNTVLVSGSEDGDVSEQLLLAFGHDVIRGSTSRGGARALREMLGVLESGGVLAITPDGPRGPRHSTNPGLAWMARATGHGIVPCGFVCDRAWRARSWDRFTIPKPGARLAFTYEEPVFVPRDADEAAQAEATALLRERMLRAEARGFERLGVPPDW
jgi:lysophospholipid acyltransferase (LPLAT)-like uncharacterized protein